MVTRGDGTARAGDRRAKAWAPRLTRWVLVIALTTIALGGVAQAAVAAPNCPCSLWPSSAAPTTAADSDTNPWELGVRFKSDVAGYVTGVRFYKGPGNTGTHVGHLWSASGQSLAQATFTNETATGWQEVKFASPV